jgi:hypothetical protein
MGKHDRFDVVRFPQHCLAIKADGFDSQMKLPMGQFGRRWTGFRQTKSLGSLKPVSTYRIVTVNWKPAMTDSALNLTRSVPS